MQPELLDEQFTPEQVKFSARHQIHKTVLSLSAPVCEFSPQKSRLALVKGEEATPVPLERLSVYGTPSSGTIHLGIQKGSLEPGRYTLTVAFRYLDCDERKKTQPGSIDYLFEILP